MCDKCESPATTEFLSSVALIPRDIYSVYDWKQSVRAIIRKRNYSEALIKGYQHNGEQWAMARRPSDLIRGKDIAKARAIAFKEAARIPTTLLEAENVLNYIDSLSQLIQEAAERIEPKLYEAKDAMYEGVWEMIELFKLSADGDLGGMIRNVQYSLDKLHMVHVSHDNPMQVAYYPSLRHLHEGRVVKTKIGKYLTNFKDMYGLTDKDIKDMTEKHVSIMSARGAWAVAFIEHDNAQGWVDVYNMMGVDSCMKGKDAVRVYANELSQLRLAHIINDGKLVARCIVRDDPDGNKTGWIRVYPDPNGYAEGRFMKDWLESNGYPDRTELDGCLLTADAYGSGYVCPYLDCGSGGSQSVSATYRDGVEYLYVGGDEFQATNTNGYTEDAEEEDSCTCDECGNGYDQDDTRWVESMERTVCNDCISEYYVTAYGRRYEDLFRVEDCIEVNGTWYQEDTCEYHGIFVCEVSGEYMHTDDMEGTMVGLVDAKLVMALDHADDNENDFAVCDDTATLSDGTTCHKDNEEALQATIDFDTQDEPTIVGVSDETTGE